MTVLQRLSIDGLNHPWMHPLPGKVLSRLLEMGWITKKMSTPVRRPCVEELPQTQGSEGTATVYPGNTRAMAQFKERPTKTTYTVVTNDVRAEKRTTRKRIRLHFTPTMIRTSNNSIIVTSALNETDLDILL
jgi:hypothetical protein